MRLFSHFVFSGIMLAATAFFSAAGQAENIKSAEMQVKADQSVLTRGRYLAIASDCSACHTVRGAGDDRPFAGGYVFKLPMGQIISSNITPSRQFGIGNWSEEDFARAVREGIAPDGTHLYPAMPYTDYSLMTDDDIHALYVYFMRGVAPVDAAPALQTSMNFPFNFRAGLSLWNMLFLDNKRFEPDPAVSVQINRGRYLVDGPAHCGTCHTPRNFLMAESKKNYLAGAVVSGWWAPNLTSDPVGGLGGWSEQEIVTYLRTGHVRNKSQANGPMAEAVEYSFRYMSESDLEAIAAYIKTVPPLPTKGQVTPAFAAHKPKDTDFTQYEFPLAGSAAPYSSISSTVNGAVLYNTACASCHGVNGQGADDGSSPSLLQNRAVGVANADSLIMTIAYGLNRDGADRKYSMPGFLASTNPIFDAMNEEQIAAVVNYVRNNFGNSDEKITAAEVKTALGGGKMPFLIEHAALLSIIGGVIVLLVLLWFVRCLIGRRKHRRTKRVRHMRHEQTGIGKKSMRAEPYKQKIMAGAKEGMKAAPKKKPGARRKK